MQLSQLISQSLPIDCDVVVNGLTLDSRAVQPGFAFLALKGTRADGKSYIDDAISRGASVILIDSFAKNARITHKKSIPIIPITDLAGKVALLAAEFYGHPAKYLRIIGVTGTSGKTSCTHYIAQI